MKYSNETTNYIERDELFCNLCGLQETLWVCLTCAFVGCGRYSNKHAAEHNDKTHHPFCLELSTLRIWSYVDGEYVHRTDLLECPASLQNMHQLMSTPRSSYSSFIAFSSSSTVHGCVNRDNHGSMQNISCIESLDTAPGFDVPVRLESDNYDRMVASSFASVDEKSPKKATMIGEEYEVLLQSALEEQAQYYEGEIAWLRATLSG
jgi:BRCA1-associated protein